MVAENTTIKLYENPPYDEGIFLRFKEAIRILSTKTGLLSERVCSAYYDSGVFHLSSNLFTDKFIKTNLEKIENNITSVSPMPCQRKKFNNIHYKKLIEMAECMFSIYTYLIDIKISENQNNK